MRQPWAAIKSCCKTIVRVAASAILKKMLAPFAGGVFDSRKNKMNGGGMPVVWVVAVIFVVISALLKDVIVPYPVITCISDSGKNNAIFKN